MPLFWCFRHRILQRLGITIPIPEAVMAVAGLTLSLLTCRHLILRLILIIHTPIRIIPVILLHIHPRLPQRMTTITAILLTQHPIILYPFILIRLLSTMVLIADAEIATTMATCTKFDFILNIG